MGWEFKEKILYGKIDVTQDSRKFEILVEKYLQEHYPLENWKLTRATGDGNRDVESICEFSGTSMWAEAKYTTHNTENISSRKFDSTLVSSLFEKDLIKIYFVTNACIGSNTIGRIRKYYYKYPVKQIVFVDGNTLEMWIKSNPQLETQFFKSPINIMLPKTPTVILKCTRVLCMSDSYSFDSILDGEYVYPLYLSKNYTIEGDFIALGFENHPLKLYCNDNIVFNNSTIAEIRTFSYKINTLQTSHLSDSDYQINIAYELEGTKYACGRHSIKFAMIENIYKSQLACYEQIEKGIKNGYKKIYNIFGAADVGKSWIANNLKNDLLNRSNESNRIIYIKFLGNTTDIGDICRILFTLLFDYYNLGVSAKTLQKYCKNWDIKNSLFSHSNITSLIDALCNENYSLVQAILSGSVFSNTQIIFEIKNSFAYEKIYFIDNIHLLSLENKKILETILKAFNPESAVTFILTNREKLDLVYTYNIKIDYIEEDEILNTLNEKLAIPLINLQEVLPKKHILKVPRLLNSFRKDLQMNWTCIDIKNHYFHNFLPYYGENIRIEFDMNNELLLLICLVKEGIPLDNLLDAESSNSLSELLNCHYIVQKNGYLYPNLEVWNGKIVIPKNKNNEIRSKLLILSEKDTQRKEIYYCALITHFAHTYNSYFPSIFSTMEQAFQCNDFYRTIFLGEALYKQAIFYTGDTHCMLTVMYYMAFSYMHCDGSKDVKKIFKEIIDHYSIKVKDDLYFSAKSEIVDFDYWSFNCFDTLPTDIEKLLQEWEDTQRDLPTLDPRPYLTAQNRMMVTYLALDNIEKADEWLHTNLNSANFFHTPEHLGYSHMDYAKGIYHRDLNFALKHLQRADGIFVNMPHEIRRHLDCQCEIQYVKLLLGEGNLQQLLLAQEALFDHQYWIQYYKCYIKLAVVHTLAGRIDEAKSCLLCAEASDIINHSERAKYLISVLSAYLYQKPSKYENMHLNQETSYYTIAQGAKKNSVDVVITPYIISTNTFCIDPRAW